MTKKRTTKVSTKKRSNYSVLLLALILSFAAFLLFYNLSETMIFIGDFGWFYLSARDMLLTGDIPLVGIPSSQTWLHQGPLWTYMLSLPLWIFKFHPLSGGYLVSFLGIVTVFMIYFVCLEMFNKKIAVISALLYASSPLIVIFTRMPYHTSPIPLFTLLLILSMYKWIKGNVNYFLAVIFFLSILYNLELATIVLSFVVFIILFYGAWQKEKWFQNLWSKKIIIFSLLACIIPMFPILIYDVQHGFLQTVKYVHWIVYHRIIRDFLLSNTHVSFLQILTTMMPFFVHVYQQLIFIGNSFISLIIFIITVRFITLELLQGIKKQYVKSEYVLFFLWLFIPLTVLFFNKTPSYAYIPILFPVIIILTALSLDNLMSSPLKKTIGFLAVLFMVCINSYLLITKNYFMSTEGYGLPFSKRLEIATKIVKKSERKEYTLAGEGQASEFESFTMNYEYLTWWLGHPPVTLNTSLRITINEDLHTATIYTEKKMYD